jgi:hypothetical protein
MVNVSRKCGGFYSLRACGFSGLAVVLAAGTIAAFPAAAAPAAAAATRGTAGTYLPAAGFKPGPGLAVVSAVRGTSHAWAAGGGGFSGASYALRFNGNKWTRVAKGIPAQVSIEGISTVSKNVALIAGSTGGVFYGDTEKPFLARSSSAGSRFRRWNLGWAGPGDLEGVSAVSATDAWAVGAQRVKGKHRPLALRWNGKSWKKVRVLSEQVGLQLGAVAVASRHNAWAIATNAAGNSELLRWNGKRWSLSYSPPSGTVLSAVAASSATRAWVVGNKPNQAATAGFSARWNGQKWLTAKVPELSLQLSGVTMTGKKAWAVGEEWASSSSDRTVPLMLHSAGDAWHKQAAPDPGASKSAENQSAFRDTSAASSRFVIAVGDNGIQCGSGSGFADIYRNGTWHAAAPAGERLAMTAPRCGG